MRVASLGSGSRGNATLVSHRATTLLIDNGFSLRECETRLARLGSDAEAIDAIVVSHEHGDHLAGAGAFARRYGVPVWLSAGTLKAAAAALGELPHTEVFSTHTAFAIGDLLVEPVTVPHDAREPCQFIVDDGRTRLGLLTDTGHLTAHIRRRFDGLDGLLLEFNHDADLLRAGPYPEALKLRVGGPLGHLSNDQAAELLRAIDTGRLRLLVAMHLSQQNNRPDLVMRAVATALDDIATGGITVADQELGFAWRTLD